MNIEALFKEYLHLHQLTNEDIHNKEVRLRFLEKEKELIENITPNRWNDIPAYNQIYYVGYCTSDRPLFTPQISFSTSKPDYELQHLKDYKID